MSEPKLDIGEGPWILHPGGGLESFHAKFPDKGEWPSKSPLDAFFREMAHMTAAMSLAKYTVLLSGDDDVETLNGFPMNDSGAVRKWIIPEELVRICPWPIAIFSVASGGSDVWRPLHLIDRAAIVGVDGDDINVRYELIPGEPDGSDPGPRHAKISMENRGSDSFDYRGCLIFYPYRTKTFRKVFNGHDA
jgi:hypothetical protein